jgi:cobalt-zinc-cadmium efflux system membrane fusion protein
LKTTGKVNQKIITALFALTALAACGKKEGQQEENKKFVLSDSMQHMIQIDTVQYCNLSDELSLTGEVSFNENNVVKVFPRSSGQVLESHASLGDKVSKGQVLAVIRSADVAGNYSDLSSTNADVTIAKRQMENAESLYKNGINSEREYIEAKQNYEKALAARNKVQSVININGGGKTSATGTYTLTAPIDGYIVEKKITTGAFIRPDMGDNLFTISNLKNVWIYANVYESDIAKVKEGYDATVIPMAYPDKKYDAKIDKISQVLDPQSKSMRVRVTLENRDMLLKPDMFAKVIVANKEGTTATCIPTAAIVSQDGKNYVVTYKSNSDMAINEVDIIKTVGDKTFVRSGLQQGQKLITKNQLFIFNQLLNE